MHILQSPIVQLRRMRRRALRHIRSVLSSDTMRNDVYTLVSTISDPAVKKAFTKDMQSFSKLLNRYIAGSTDQLDWDKVKFPAAHQIIPYHKLPQSVDDMAVLKKLAVLKVNGGLGTSMGMHGAKSALEVKDGLTFLDLIIQQIAHLNATHNVDVPLLLMNSFNTHEDTLRVIQNHDSKTVRTMAFRQSKYPRIWKESFALCPQNGEDEKEAWYPPGHGDLYTSLYGSGILDCLLKEGKRYLFISNSENLGAVVDARILRHMVDTQAEFLMEVIEKTKADVRGGSLIEYDGTIRLLDIAQVPSNHSAEFQSGQKFKILDTNNLWINLKALKRVMKNGGMELDIIANSQVMDEGKTALQLETAAGAAIRYFSNTRGVNVPRSRFLPIKNCGDLLLLKSNMYSIEHGHPVIDGDRTTVPIIKLDDNFQKVQDFQTRFKSIPDMVDLDHLTVSGNVHFGRGVVLRGTVTIVATEGERLDIPDRCVLDNCLISGNLKMIEI